MTSRIDFSPASSIDHAVDAQRDAAVRRRAVGERIEKEAEALARRCSSLRPSALNMRACTSWR